MNNIKQLFKKLFYSEEDLFKKIQEIQCPVCGYYCSGKGGLGCIDKPTFVDQASKRLENK